jgi:hypothetical protein
MARASFEAVGEQTAHINGSLQNKGRGKKLQA